MYLQNKKIILHFLLTLFFIFALVPRAFASNDVKQEEVDKLKSFVGGGVDKSINVPKSQIVQLEELKAFVNSGIDYFKEHGQEESFKEFSNPYGKFTLGDMYLFVVNYQGVYLAYGGPSKERIGKNMYDKRDEFGTPYVQLFIDTAKSGGGIVGYYSLEPTTGKIELKTSYLKPLTNDTFIGAGIYE